MARITKVTRFKTEKKKKLRRATKCPQVSQKSQKQKGFCLLTKNPGHKYRRNRKKNKITEILDPEFTLRPLLPCSSEIKLLCSDVWHFCSKRSKDKLEQLNKQALRTVLNSNSDYETLLLRIIGSVNLESSRVQNMLITTYKTLYGIAPPYLKLLLKERKVAYNLRGTLKLNLPRVTTTTYGLHSFRYAATQVWNMLPDDIRTSESRIAFKRAIQDITA